jgi:hypothetical protein
METTEHLDFANTAPEHCCYTNLMMAAYTSVAKLTEG